jgi:hypothetical protein
VFSEGECEREAAARATTTGPATAALRASVDGKCGACRARVRRVLRVRATGAACVDDERVRASFASLLFLPPVRPKARVRVLSARRVRPKTAATATTATPGDGAR